MPRFNPRSINNIASNIESAGINFLLKNPVLKFNFLPSNEILNITGTVPNPNNSINNVPLNTSPEIIAPDKAR